MPTSTGNLTKARPSTRLDRMPGTAIGGCLHIGDRIADGVQREVEIAGGPGGIGAKLHRIAAFENPVRVVEAGEPRQESIKRY